MSEIYSQTTAETGKSVESQRSGPVPTICTSPSTADPSGPEKNAESEWVMRKISTLDSEYVKKHLGIPLSLALSEILSRRPSDPIHYLGHWLLKWRWNQDQKQMEEDRINDLLADRRRMAEEIEEEKRIEEEKIENARRELRIEAEIIARDWVNALCDKLELPDLPEPPPEPEVPEVEVVPEDDEEMEPTDVVLEEVEGEEAPTEEFNLEEAPFLEEIPENIDGFESDQLQPEPEPEIE